MTFILIVLALATVDALIILAVNWAETQQRAERAKRDARGAAR